MHRSAAFRRASVILVLGVAVGLTACTAASSPTAPAVSSTTATASAPTVDPAAAAPPPSSPPPTTTPPTTTPPSTTPPVTEPGSSGPPTSNAAVAGVASAVEATLRALAESRDSVTSDEVRAAIEQGFVEAGSAPETVEVSIDRTPTGLDVDAIQGAGLLGGTCVVAEVREGDVSVVVLPALGSGTCFVGDQR